jgi:uncharacterized protein YutE (UPF0331/DUF86 family)
MNNLNTIKEALGQELVSLNNARDILRYSYEKCLQIGIKSEFNYEELESFEALTSRFARLSDMIIQKIFRFFEVLDLEEQGTIRDRINRAERKGIIESADDFIQARILRNEIAHEYESEHLYEIFQRVIELSPVLLESVDRILEYSQQYFEEHHIPGSE